MTDEQEKSASDKPADSSEKESEGPRCGELLARARRDQEISVTEIAKELHLDEHKVRALECNDFESLGAPVFAKGHLRAYAELVGIDEGDILTDYYRLTRQDNLPPVVVARRRMRKEVSPGPWIAVIVVIIVVAAAYYWFAVFSLHESTTDPDAPAAPQQQQQSETDFSAPPASDASETEPPVADEPPVVSSEPEPAVAEPATEEVAAREPEPRADGEVALTLSFSGDCWTEVSDATGRRLYFEMGRAGETLELTGIAPFAVLFGDVDNVSVQVDGNDYPVRTSNPGSRTARLTINQP